MGRLLAGAITAVLLLAAPALAAGPGKRFAHNRGTWTGFVPIEVVGHVDHPRSIAVRVRWRTLEPPEPTPAPAPPPEDGPLTDGFRAAATPIPGAGITAKWRLTCPLGSTRAARRTGTLTSTSSPDIRALPLPRRGLPFCLVTVDAAGPGGWIGKIMLDLYART
jgi:hypothetical protein